MRSSGKQNGKSARRIARYRSVLRELSKRGTSMEIETESMSQNNDLRMRNAYYTLLRIQLKWRLLGQQWKTHWSQLQ